MSLLMTKYSPYYYSVVKVDGREFRKSTKTANKRMAQKIDEEHRREILDRLSSGVTEILVSEAVSKYLSFKKWKSDGQWTRLTDFLGKDRKLSQVDNRDLHLYVEKLRHEGLKDSSIGVLLVKAKSFFTWCKRNKFAAQELEFPKTKSAEKRVRFLTLEDEKRILNELALDRQFQTAPKDKDADVFRHIQDARDVFVALLDTGARVGEVCALKWRDINIDEGTIHLYRQKTRNTSILHMTNRLQAVMRRRFTERRCDYVFPNDRFDGPRSRKNAVIINAIKRAGLKDFVIHDLRHAAVARMLRGGMNLYECGQMLGHASTNTTARYAFLEQEVTSRKAKKILDDSAERLEEDRTSQWLQW